jgi:hypothetical protein
MSKLGTITIMGEEVVVDADVNGSFWLYIEHPSEEEGGRPRTDHLGRGDSLEAAKRQARTALSKRRVEVAVPFRMSDGRRGVAIKRNLRTRGVIVEIDGERDELAPNSGSVLKEDAPDNVIEELKLREGRIRADQAVVNTIYKEWGFRSLGSRLDQVVAETAERETAGATA